MVMRSDNVLNASTSQIADTRGDVEILAVGHQPHAARIGQKMMQFGH